MNLVYKYIILNPIDYKKLLVEGIFYNIDFTIYNTLIDAYCKFRHDFVFILPVEESLMQKVFQQGLKFSWVEDPYYIYKERLIKIDYDDTELPVSERINDYINEHNGELDYSYMTFKNVTYPYLKKNQDLFLFRACKFKELETLFNTGEFESRSHYNIHFAKIVDDVLMYLDNRMGPFLVVYNKDVVFNELGAQYFHELIDPDFKDYRLFSKKYKSIFKGKNQLNFPGIYSDEDNNDHHYRHYVVCKKLMLVPKLIYNIYLIYDDKFHTDISQLEKEYEKLINLLENY